MRSLESLSRMYGLSLNSHEFTLAALTKLLDDRNILFRKIRAIKLGNQFRFIIVIGGIYYIYDNLNRRLKRIENQETPTK